MVSGGAQLTAADKAEYSRLEEQLAGQQEALQQLSGELEDLRQTTSDVGSDAALAKQDLEGSKNKVEAAEKQLDDFQHQIEDFKGQLAITQNNVARAFDMANFYKRFYEKEFADDVMQRGLEAYYESRNNQLEAFVAAIGSFFNFAAVNAGLGYRGKSEFTPVKYLQPEQPAQDQSPEHYARAQSAQGEYEAQLNRQRELESDPFYANNLSDAQVEFADDQADDAAQDANKNKALERYRAQRDVQIAQARDAITRTERAMRIIRDKQNA